MSDPPELLYDDLALGREFRETATTLTPDLIRSYAVATGDDALGREAEQPSGTILSDPTLGILFAITRRVIAHDGVAPGGGVLAGQDCAFGRPFRLGETITTRASITQKYEKRGRRFLVVRCRLVDHEGTDVGYVDSHVIWAR